MMLNFTLPAVPLDPDPRFPIAVQNRLHTAGATAQKNSARLAQVLTRSKLKTLTADANALLRSNRPITAKLESVWKLADEVARAARPFAACKKGCTHCCYIPVTLGPVEAAVIGKYIKRAPASPKLTLTTQQQAGYNNPCVFLKEGSCSIYAYRPFSCRVQFNLDEDALLCELVEDLAIPVPYLNASALQLLYAMLFNEGLADIREFFPTAFKLSTQPE